MLRRKPTRIELKIDDLEEYSKKIKEAREAANRQNKVDPNLTPGIFNTKTRTDIINERIGYDPRPLPQPSSIPLHH